MAKDYYKILEVDKKASDADIKKSYRKLAKKYHPDVNPGNKQAEERFKEINEAYAVLSDKIKRNQYDQMGHAGFKSKFNYEDIFSGFSPDQDIFGSFFRGNQRGGFSSDFNGDIGSLFNNIFSGRGHQRAPRRGSDFEYEMTIDFLTSINGGEREVKFDLPGKDLSEKIRVKIPKGIKDGQKIRLKGKGDNSPGGGERGDLYIKLKVLQHPYFKRVENDINVEVPISIFESVLGAKIEVPTLNGKTKVTIPKGTQGGQRLRLKGKGVKAKDGSVGDQYVIIKIAVPKNLDDKSEKIFEELSKTNSFNPRDEVFD